MTKPIIDLKNFKPIPVPRKVAVCPYCDDDPELIIEGIDAWSIDDNGKITPEEIVISCVNEPDIDDEDYVESHTYMPYVYWLPVHQLVKRWLVAAFEFIDGDKEKEKLDRWTDAAMGVSNVTV